MSKLIPNHQQGFSLIELMIVIVIVGILTSIAVPSYQQYVLRANRVDATTYLLNIAAEQEKFYLQNNTYASDIGDLGLTAASPDGYYTVALSGADASGYTATATVVAGARQAEDAAYCDDFAIDETGAKTVGSGSETEDRCWGR